MPRSSDLLLLSVKGGAYYVIANGLTQPGTTGQQVRTIDMMPGGRERSIYIIGSICYRYKLSLIGQSTSHYEVAMIYTNSCIFTRFECDLYSEGWLHP
jgi:hypothetical protein